MIHWLSPLNFTMRYGAKGTGSVVKGGYGDFSIKSGSTDDEVDLFLEKSLETLYWSLLELSLHQENQGA